MNDMAKNVLTDSGIIGISAAAGAALGSCVPIFGTAIGAGIGAIIGGTAVIIREIGRRKKEKPLDHVKKD